jgi:protein-S-isoprenylcysteine O-methyltransferase Ste14
MMTDKTAEHALLLFLSFCGLLLIRISTVSRSRSRHLAVFHIDAGTFGREKSFIRADAYQFIRHPFHGVLLLLAAAQVLAAAQALMLQNWIGGIAAIITFLIVYLVRMPVDEQRAMELYGHSHLEHMDSTNSLVPRLFSRRKE